MSSNVSDESFKILPIVPASDQQSRSSDFGESIQIVQEEARVIVKKNLKAFINTTRKVSVAMTPSVNSVEVLPNVFTR